MIDEKFGQFGELSSDDPGQESFVFTKKQKPELLLILKKEEEGKDYEIVGQSNKRGDSLMFTLLNILFLGRSRKFFLKKEEDENHITLKSGGRTVEVLPKEEFKKYWDETKD